MDTGSHSRREILALYGEAMLEAQRFEEELIGLLGVRQEIESAERGVPRVAWTLLTFAG